MNQHYNARKENKKIHHQIWLLATFSHRPKYPNVLVLQANCNDISLCIICYTWTSLNTVVCPFLMPRYLELFLLKSWTNQPKWVRCTSIGRKHAQSSWQSTRKSLHQSKPTGKYTHWGESARHRATFIFWPARVLFALHNRWFFLVSFVAIKRCYAVKHTENTAVKHIKSGKGPLW